MLKTITWIMFILEIVGIISNMGLAIIGKTKIKKESPIDYYIMSLLNYI